MTCLTFDPGGIDANALCEQALGPKGGNGTATKNAASLPMGSDAMGSTSALREAEIEWSQGSSCHAAFPDIRNMCEQQQLAQRAKIEAEPSPRAQQVSVCTPSSKRDDTPARVRLLRAVTILFADNNVP